MVYLILRFILKNPKGALDFVIVFSFNYTVFSCPLAFLQIVPIASSFNYYSPLKLFVVLLIQMDLRFRRLMLCEPRDVAHKRNSIVLPQSVCCCFSPPTAPTATSKLPWRPRLRSTIKDWWSGNRRPFTSRLVK